MYWVKNNETGSYFTTYSHETWMTKRDSMADYLAGFAPIERFQGERTIVASNGTRLWV